MRVTSSRAGIFEAQGKSAISSGKKVQVSGDAALAFQAT
jgi:hypothetical protein